MDKKNYESVQTSDDGPLAIVQKGEITVRVKRGSGDDVRLLHYPLIHPLHFAQLTRRRRRRPWKSS